MAHTLLERKIRWYLANCEKTIDEMAFDLILVAKFDEHNKLTFSNQEEIKAIHMKYWNKLLQSK